MNNCKLERERERERETGTKYMNVVGTNGERREGFDHWVRFTRPT